MHQASSNKPDWLIVGGGILGLTLARELRERFPSDTIEIFEKEPRLGAHASGRNSGVLHAGIYYPPGSLKARLCVQGQRLMKDYCRDRDVPLLETGKLIIPTDADEVKEVERLAGNAQENGVSARVVSADEARELEPAAYHELPCLFSPETAVVEPTAVLRALREELLSRDVVFATGVRVLRVREAEGVVETTGGPRSFGRLINVAGAHADRLAHACGLGLSYRMFPFRGAYYHLKPTASVAVRRNLYPVPDTRMPFLGVHFTPHPDGSVSVGPTAAPALGREHYGMLKGLEFAEAARMTGFVARNYAADRQGFRALVHREIRRLWKPSFLREAQRLVPGVRSQDLTVSKESGIRAQLVDLSSDELVMDFHVETGRRTVHVLNAVSPAFTSSFAFAQYVVDGYL